MDELLEKLEVADEEEHVVDSTQLDYEEAPMARRDMLKLRNEIIALPGKLSLLMTIANAFLIFKMTNYCVS